MALKSHLYAFCSFFPSFYSFAPHKIFHHNFFHPSLQNSHLQFQRHLFSSFSFRVYTVSLAPPYFRTLFHIFTPPSSSMEVRFIWPCSTIPSHQPGTQKSLISKYINYTFLLPSSIHLFLLILTNSTQTKITYKPLGFSRNLAPYHKSLLPTCVLTLSLQESNYNLKKTFWGSSLAFVLYISHFCAPKGRLTLFSTQHSLIPFSFFSSIALLLLQNGGMQKEHFLFSKKRWGKNQINSRKFI